MLQLQPFSKNAQNKKQITFLNDSTALTRMHRLYIHFYSSFVEARIYSYIQYIIECIDYVNHANTLTVMMTPQRDKNEHESGGSWHI